MAAVDTDYNSCSLDRSSMKIKRKPSRKKPSNTLPVPLKSGSLEDVTITGTQVKEIPVDFPVNMDALLNRTDQVMDIELRENGSNDHFHRAVEGKVIPSREAIRRLSTKKRKSADKLLDDEMTKCLTDSNHSESDTQEEMTPIIKLNTADELTSSEFADGLGEVIRIHHCNGMKILSNNRDSTDSGIAISEMNDREAATHGNSTENSPTDTSITLRDHVAPATNHLKLIKGSPFDSLKYGTKRHRDSMLLSQLCVVTVTLPADIQQGQKGRGATLKFRFSPYTQIETLRVAILKVHIYCYNHVYCCLF